MKLSSLKYLLSAILAVSGFSGLAAQSVVILKKGMHIRDIAAQCSYFCDSTNALSIDEISASSVQALFRNISPSETTIGLSRSAYWVRIQIAADPKENWYLESEPSDIDTMQFFYATGDGSWHSSLNGFEASFQEREVRAPNILFVLAATPDTVTYYLRIKSTFPIFFHFKAGPAVEFLIRQNKSDVMNGMYLGIMLIMTLYNLFLFFTNRNRVYVFYALYMLFAAIFVVYSTGYCVYLPDIVRIISNWNHILVPFAFGLFGLFFTQQFLYTKKYAPRLHRFIYYFAAAVFLLVIIDFFDKLLASALLQVTGGILTIVCITVGIVVLRKGYRPARYYLMGFGIYTLGISSYIVIVNARISLGDILPSDILMMTSAIEAIVLSFAIGDKLNSALREKQEAQEANMAALRANEQLVREQNVVLEQKVEERTREISEQKEIIEEKNKDILDSIHYAKRIQGALMASDNLLKKNLPEYFIVYKPKDIVSGDFYFGAESGDHFWLCVGDCTGHGVPGAFMSLLNISVLRESIVDLTIQRPDEVLNMQREAIIHALNPHGAGESAKDGMDCILMCFDKNSSILKFACANNPLWIIRNQQLLEFAPDKQPVGLHEGVIKPFTCQQVQLQKGDYIIALTDGFADQFGGPRGKKYKYAQLKSMIIPLAQQSPENFRKKLDVEFENWRGSLEQVDDVLIVGIQV